jgi:phage baseplate assembly protein W
MIKLTRFTENLDSSGDFLTLEDIDSVIDGIIKTLSIPRGSYIGDPEVGSEIYKYIYRPLDEDTLSDLETEIMFSIEQIDNVVVQSVNAVALRNNKSIAVEIDIILFGKISKKLSIMLEDRYVSLLEVE